MTTEYEELLYNSISAFKLDFSGEFVENPFYAFQKGMADKIDVIPPHILSLVEEWAFFFEEIKDVIPVEVPRRFYYALMVYLEFCNRGHNEEFVLSIDEFMTFSYVEKPSFVDFNELVGRVDSVLFELIIEHGQLMEDLEGLIFDTSIKAILENLEFYVSLRLSELLENKALEGERVIDIDYVDMFQALDIARFRTLDKLP